MLKRFEPQIRLFAHSLDAFCSFWAHSCYSSYQFPTDIKIVENWGDDVPEGKLTSFTMAVKREDSESIVFSWITWPSKNMRDEAWKQVMADPIMQGAGMGNLFDGKRMIFGGFQTIVQA